MKYDRSDSFLADYRRLSPQERRLFMDAVGKMIEACNREPGRIPHWPAALRIEQLEGRPGLYEMTWSFAGPDGRATFEFTQIDGQLALRWRRVGDHRILREP